LSDLTIFSHCDKNQKIEIPFSTPESLDRLELRIINPKYPLEMQVFNKGEIRLNGKANTKKEATDPNCAKRERPEPIELKKEFLKQKTRRSSDDNTVSILICPYTEDTEMFVCGVFNVSYSPEIEPKVRKLSWPEALKRLED
jgi:hypothetical protein